MTEAYREWPPHFQDWPRRDQVAYLELRYNRPDLMREIGRRAGIESLSERELDISNCRLSKGELAELALYLGIHVDATYSQEDDQ